MIAQNTQLFSLLGTTYGGDGEETFALPNLQGRVPIQAGQGPGLSPRVLGETGGETTVTLTSAEMPAHNHLARATSAPGTQNGPAGHVWAAGVGRRGQRFYTDQPGTSPEMSASALAAAGGGAAHNNMPPYLALNFIIATTGPFPARP
jgi:microcystin-dependent protein